MIEQDPSIEDSATQNKAYFRRGKSYYHLAKQIFEMSEQQYDPDNMEIDVEQKFPHLRSIVSDTFDEDFWAAADSSLSKEEQHGIKVQKLKQISLELYRRFDDDFYHMDSTEEGKKSHQEMVILGLNRLLLNNIKPKTCTLCHASSENNENLSFLPSKIFEDLQKRVTMKMDIPLEEDGSQKSYPLLCSKCHAKIEKRRSDFVEKVWNLYIADTENSVTVSEKDTKCISSFICICAWFYLMTTDLNTLGWDHVSKTLQKLLKLILSPLEQSFATTTFMFTSKPDGYQMSKQVSDYLKNYSVSRDVDFHQGKPNYLHFKLDALHFVQGLGGTTPLDLENCAVPSKRELVIEQASQRVVPTTFNELLERITANRLGAENSMSDE